MSAKQRWVLIVAFTLCLAMFAFPPTGSPTEYGRLGYHEYMFLLDISGSRTIDYWRLLIQFGFVLVPAWFIGFYRPREE